MDTIKEPARNIAVVENVDIVLIGGSCTGVFAAVRAARLGMRVAIIEKQNCFGGMATAGNVSIWHSLKNTTGDTQIIAGLTQEMIERLKKRGAVMANNSISTAFRLNTEEMKTELDELVQEHNITPYLHTFYAAPVMVDGKLDAVIIENKNGRQAIRAKMFIDASGDGDVAFDLGVPSRTSERLQPPTLCAKVQGWDSIGGFDWQAAIKDHGAEFGLEPDWGWGTGIPGMPGIQMRADCHIFNADLCDATDLTFAEMEGRRKVRAMLDVIRAYGPQDIDLTLVDLAAAIGIRETRHIKAQYTLTGEDVLSGRNFDDAIGYGSYPVDRHHANGAGITFHYLDGTKKTVPERGAKPIMGRWRDPLPVDPTYYQVPFRSLVLERVPNLVMAGRMLDADEKAFSAVRVMVNTNQMGEAAGVACALAIEKDSSISDVNLVKLRETLQAGGSVTH